MTAFQPNAFQTGFSTGEPLPLIGKHVLAHVYDSSGAYLRTWDDLAVQPRFVWPLNGGPGPMEIVLPRRWGAAGEPGEPSSLEDLRFGNKVKLYVVDTDTGVNGVLLYQGIIDDYTQTLANEAVSITLIPKTSYFGDRVIYPDDVVFEDTDPNSMAFYFVDNDYLPGVSWNFSVAGGGAVGQTYSETFPANMKLKQAFDIIQNLAGGRWFYRLDPEEVLSFGSFNTREEPHHSLVIGKHVSANVKFRKSRLELYKRVIVTGAAAVPATDTEPARDAVHAFAQVAGYDPTDEPRDLYYASRSITEANTAKRIATSLLEFYSKPSYETEIEVIDNNYSFDAGYNIEAFRPGDTVALRNPENAFAFRLWGDDHTWGDGGIWGGTWLEQVQKPLVIARVDYQFDRAILTLQNRPINVPEAMASLSDRLALVGA